MNTPRELAAQILPASFLDTCSLAEHGLNAHAVSRLVREGGLLRLRKGRYVRPDAHPELIRAGRLGGRLDCVSLLSTLGIFVHTRAGLHVQVEAGSSRLPVPPDSVTRHWRRSTSDREHLPADLIAALAQACRCQHPRDAIATLDSAWHHRLVDQAGIDAVFRLLPRRWRRIRGLLDRRAESGPETIVRLMLLGLGSRVDVQVVIRGVGRVDLVADGWLIIECDSQAHHQGWQSQKRDRRRDLAAAALGYTTVRPIAEDILYRREEVLAMLKAALASPAPRPGSCNSSDSVAKLLEQP